MIVNTGRAASRAFSINLYDQPGVTTFPRYAFDKVARAFVEKGNARPLRQMARQVSALTGVSGQRGPLGIVFHGMRPRLAHPFDSAVNVRLLEAVKSELGVDSVFLVVRDPEALMLSELNRSAARPEGDWSFATGQRGWQDSYTLADLARLRRTPASDHGPARQPIGIDLESTVQALSQRTGDFQTVWTLFSKVFHNLHIVPYASFVNDPDGTMRAIGHKAGLSMVNSPLAHAKLNSLSNRLMIYNPVTLALPDMVSRSVTSVLRRRPLGTLRFRFELRDVIPYCSDWGQYLPTGLDCSAVLGGIAEDVGHPVSLGIHLEDLQALPYDLGRMITQQPFLEELVETLGEVFRVNYDAHRAFYKSDVYFKDIPDRAREIFLERNGAHIDAFRDMMTRGEAKSVFDG